MSELPSFAETLASRGLALTRGETRFLQINVGLLCDHECRHCRLRAGPLRREVMTEETMDHVVAFATTNRFSTIDVTGGAPELHPKLAPFVARLAPLCDRVVLRSNLTALDAAADALLPVLAAHRVAIAASFPSLDAAETDEQRGAGTFPKSLAALKRLNAAGWGMPGTGLELLLVANPRGDALPEPQERIEARFRARLANEHGIRYTKLLSFNNLPLGQFRDDLAASGRLDGYLRLLESSFNPRTVAGLMCRDTLSISWDGSLFDCDFNIEPGLFLGGQRINVRDAGAPPEPGTPVALGDHCYACTASAGFT